MVLNLESFEAPRTSFNAPIAPTSWVTEDGAPGKHKHKHIPFIESRSNVFDVRLRRWANIV